MISDIDNNLTQIRQVTGGWGLPGLPDGVAYDLAINSGLDSGEISSFLNGLSFDYGEKEKESQYVPQLDVAPASLSPMATGIARPWGVTNNAWDRNQQGYQPAPLSPEGYDLTPFRRSVNYLGVGVPRGTDRILRNLASMDDAKVYDRASIRQLKMEAINEGLLPPTTPVDDQFLPNLNNVSYDLAQKKANRAIGGDRSGAVSMPQILQIVDEISSPAFLGNLASTVILGVTPGEIVQGVKTGLENWGDFTKVRTEDGFWNKAKAFVNALAGPLDDIIVPAVNVALMLAGVGEVLAVARLGRVAVTAARAGDVLMDARAIQRATGVFSRTSRFLGIGTDTARFGFFGDEAARAGALMDVTRMATPGRMVQKGAESQHLLFRGPAQALKGWRQTHTALYGRKVNQVAMRMGQWNYAQAQVFDNPYTTEVQTRIREYRSQSPTWMYSMDLLVDSFFSPWRIREWSTLKPRVMTDALDRVEEVNRVMRGEVAVEGAQTAGTTSGLMLPEISQQRKWNYVAVRDNKLLQQTQITNWVARGIAERMAAIGEEGHQAFANALRSNPRTALVEFFGGGKQGEKTAANYIRMAVSMSAIDKATAYRLSVIDNYDRLTPAEKLTRYRQLQQKTFGDLSVFDDSVEDFLDLKRRTKGQGVYDSYLRQSQENPAQFDIDMRTELQDHNAKARGLMRNMIDSLEADEVYRYIVEGRFDNVQDFEKYLDATNVLHADAMDPLLWGARKVGKTLPGKKPRSSLDISRLLAPGGPADDLRRDLLRVDPATGFSRLDTRHFSLMAGDASPTDAWWKFSLARREYATGSEMRTWLNQWERSVQVAAGLEVIANRSKKAATQVSSVIDRARALGKPLAQADEKEVRAIVETAFAMGNQNQLVNLTEAIDYLTRNSVTIERAQQELHRHLSVLDRAEEWDSVFGFKGWGSDTPNLVRRVNRKLKEGRRVSRVTADDAAIFVPFRKTKAGGVTWAKGQVRRPRGAGIEGDGMWVPIDVALEMGVDVPKAYQDIYDLGYKVVVGDEFFKYTKMIRQVLPDINMAAQSRRLTWNGIKRWSSDSLGYGILKRFERVEGRMLHRAREAAWSDAIARTLNHLIEQDAVADMPGIYLKGRKMAPDSGPVLTIRRALEAFSENQLQMRKEALLESTHLLQRSFDRQAASWGRRLPSEIGLRTLRDIEVAPGVKLSQLIPNDKDIRRLRNALRASDDLAKYDASLRPGLLKIEDMLRGQPTLMLPFTLLSRTTDARNGWYRAMGRGLVGMGAGYGVGLSTDAQGDEFGFAALGLGFGSISASQRWSERLAGIGKESGRNFKFLGSAVGAYGGGYAGGAMASAAGADDEQVSFAAAGGTIAGMLGVPAGANRLVNKMSHHALREIWYLPRHLMNVSNQLRFALSPIFDLQRYTEGAMMRWTADPGKYGLKAGELDVLTSQPLKALGGWSKRRFVTHGKYGELKGNEAFTAAMHDFDRQAARAGHVPFETGDRTVRWMLDEGILGFNPYERMVTTYAQLTESGIKADKAFDIANDIYTYGVKGRTGIELAINSMFFPFSFQSRYVGRMARWLSRDAGRALMIQDSLATANLLVENYDMDTWVDKHLPLLNQLRKINGLAFGFSLGEFGGLYRPLLDFFMPVGVTVAKQIGQTVSGAPISRVITDTGDQLALDWEEMSHRTIAAWRDIDDLVTDLKDQGHVIFGPSHLTPDFEASQGFSQLDGVKQRQEATAHMAGYEDFAAFKTALPQNAALVEAAVQREKMLIYHHHPSMIQAIADSNKRRTAADLVLRDRAANPQTMVDWETKEFMLYLDTLEAKVEAMGLTFSDVMEVPIWAQQGIRAKATELGMRNNGFDKVYDQHYRKVWGPIQSIAYGSGYLAPVWEDSGLR